MELQATDYQIIRDGEYLQLLIEEDCSEELFIENRIYYIPERNKLLQLPSLLADLPVKQKYEMQLKINSNYLRNTSITLRHFLIFIFKDFEHSMDIHMSFFIGAVPFQALLFCTLYPLY